MSVLLWIVAASVAGGALSVLFAAMFALSARPHRVGALVSYAVGALLGVVFLDILPEAMEMGSSPAAVSGTVLFGILLFFTLEKLLLWRHCHNHNCEVHELHEYGSSGRSGTLIVIGDTFHNFVDGIIIAAAFLTDVNLGIVTALAIIAHEVPQEVGDFMILLHSGYSKVKAFLVNLASSLAMLAGGVLAYFALQSMEGYVPTLLALAAASMIYVAVADLIPGLHRRTQLRDTLEQVGLIGAGIGSIFLVHLMVGA